MQPFEKLGAFYLGQEYDLAKAKRLDRLIMYDARDLTTHAVCVGMTGSGKTGLCVDLLEEAAIDSVPAIMIDPKGDLTNLLLTFPELRPEDFEPWVNVDDARRKGMSVGEYAQYIADTWRKGLDDWGQGHDRIRMLKESADFRIYTPGSDAGLPVSILASLAAPALRWDKEQELLREQIQGTVSALLGLAGIEADPLQSREHILLSHIFEHFWRQSQDLDLTGLISAIQSPPVRKVGVFDVDTFFPEKERFGLAMSLNNIVAAPSFETWLQGEPLDVSNLLYTPDGKPRHSIFYIAHLSDAERMFFVTLLLEQIVTWVRQQSGTTSLRALLYFDEVFGFFPPVAEPPSKRPLLTLLKQARAFGFGVVLTTQNPVDLDYKGLTNAGTWFIGKLQTERDKMRVLEGLESASAEAGGALDRRELDRTISALRSRIFLLHNVHEDHPVIFHTRWAMSYLRGPLTRTQVRELMAETQAEAAPDAPRPTVRRDVEAAVPRAPDGYTGAAPSLSPDVSQVFLPLRVTRKRAVSQVAKELGKSVKPTETTLIYEPSLLALGSVDFVDRKHKVDDSKDVGLLIQPGDLRPAVSWEDADPLELDVEDLQEESEPEALFGAVPSELSTASKLKALAKEFGNYLYDEERLNLYHNPTLKLYSEPGELEKEFKIRVQQAVREGRDAEVDKLRDKYQKKLDRLETRLAREERELTEDRAQYGARKREELLSAGETVVAMLGVFGRRTSRGLSTAARKRRLTTKARADIVESEEEIERLEAEIEEMRLEMKEEAEAIADRWADAAEEIETYAVKPRRRDVQVEL
ncbi:MAG: hypothetical protein CEE40_12930, partial [Chloroflexi bacterium B3_Chlor]